jgi:Ca-activated chloride channel homolog
MNKRTFLQPQLWSVLFLLFCSVSTAADYANIISVRQGEFLFNTDTPNQYQVAPTISTRVLIEVTGPIARTKVRQRFSNPSDQWISGTYAFPLPEDAAVDHMKILVGGRIIEGVIREKEQARKIYEQAKNEGKRTSLVEQLHPNLFTTSVANIAPSGVIDIEIEYQELLNLDQGDFSLRFPMAMTPRYSSDNESSFNQYDTPVVGRWVNVVERAGKTPVKSINNPSELSITVNLNAGFPIEYINSTYHSVTINNITDSKQGEVKQIKLGLSAHQSEHDFELVWKPKADIIPKGMFFIETGKEWQHGLLMVTPPLDKRLYEKRHRDITYIIDTSGSMGGESITQAKKALRQALTRLSIADRFNIIEFNSTVNSLFKKTVVATTEAIDEADEFIAALKAQGGTEMMPALEMALGSTDEGNNEGLQQIVFITDGAVEQEEKLFKLINNQLGERRLFTVAIGSAPNAYFMRKAAQFGRGSYTFIGDTQEVSEKMNQLFSKMEQVVMTDLHLEFEGIEGEVVQVLPDKLPDLYFGEPVVLSLKMKQIPERAIITGNLNGHTWVNAVRLKRSTNQSGLKVLFGRRMIESWMDNQVLGVDKEIVRKSIVDLGYYYHLVSQYTSLVAVDVTPTDKLRDFEFKQQELVKEGSYLSLAQTATNSQIQIILGFLLLLLGCAICLRKGRVEKLKVSDNP